jgi:ribonuclease HI
MATVIPILKPGKDPTNPLSYRPIALTNCLCKLLEKMINARLMFYLETNNCLSKLQSGFRRGRCTIDNIIDLEIRIRNAFAKRNHLVSIFFDIEKAYDRTWRYGILRQLHSLGLRGNLPIFIQNFLSLRYFKVRIGNILSDDFIQEEGVPQGSVLSVTLFIIAINDILNVLPTSVHANMYVDDLHISCEGADMRFIERQLQSTIYKIERWSDNNGFCFSPSKTSCMHFCRKRALHPDPEIYFGGAKIDVVSEVNFLGLIFDKKLTFQSHIYKLRKKCERSLNLLKILSNTTWGAHRSSLLKVYHAIIRSKLDYGCVAYGSARKSVLRRLDTVHHCALRLCSGAFRTSPVDSLYVDCCEPPLELRRKILSLQYYFRLSSHKSHPFHTHTFTSYLTRIYNHRPSCIPPFHYRIKKILSDFNFDFTDILPSELFYRPPWTGSSFNFLNPFLNLDKALTPDIVFKQIFYHHRHSFRDHVPIYTDGSKSNNFVGCAYAIGDKACSYRLHNALSIFSAEILAIVKALEQIRGRREKNFIIYTDSLSVLHSMSDPDHRSNALIFKVFNLVNGLISSGYSILFCWVPSHVGIEGNEIADKAAKSANNYLKLDLPYCDAKKYAVHLLYEKWQEVWDQNTHNKLRAIKQSITAWRTNPSRKYDVIITRLRIGHTRYTHRHLLLRDPAPMCQQCTTIMSVKHILVECPVYASQRLYYFQSHCFELKDILSSVPHRNIFSFIKSIGFYPHI